MPTTPPRTFADRLGQAMDETGSVACVGLDPVLEKLPAQARAGRSDVDAIGAFSQGVLAAVAGFVPAVKFQSACYERYGAPGIAHLHELIAMARGLGLVVILDAKRGDIGVTAEHYAHAAFHAAGADCLTVNPYLGPDTLEPYQAVGGPQTGLFVLVRTSNPGSDAIQNLPLADGRTVATAMGEVVASLGRKCLGNNGLSSIGAVVGATKAADAARLRAAMPDQFFLIPGYGAQGGTAADIIPMLRPVGGSIGTKGVLVTASRSVIYPGVQGGLGVSWMDGIRRAAENLNGELAQILK